MSKEKISIDKVGASRDGHTFHERWAARRALQLVFPQDTLNAIAVEGISSTETAKLTKAAGDIADLTFFFGEGDNFKNCDLLQILQFKYKIAPKPVTASYLKKTLHKFSLSLISYEKNYPKKKVEEKLSFSFVTNAEFSESLWTAIKCHQNGTQPDSRSATDQYKNLDKWCKEKGVEAKRLLSITQFHASTTNLPGQNKKLYRTLGSWSPGADSKARERQRGLEELIREKAGASGKRNNLVKREDVLDALGCDSEDDLFPAETEFVDVGIVVERQALEEARKKIHNERKPIFIFADGGVGKTVFIQSLAIRLSNDYESVIFDCFGGGSYRSEDQSRHLPKIGLLQIVNELASRGLCDPQLPTDGDADALINAARKRLKQAAETIVTRTTKKGILVIVDAADNAQLEADDRKEKAFPRLLLASLSREPIDGVKLVLTARPHRMASVVGKSEVEPFELGTFTEEETRKFLESRRNKLTELEFSTALIRSGGNARVLEYLVESWDENISGNASKEEVTVEELIKERCDKIFKDLFQVGWGDDEINQFFTAISLLPPPIPLNEMASALGWSESKVKSAVADLAPMLEVLKHGAIFRDEPTETFIRKTYASEVSAQQEIADRLYACQATSEYAAEALPRFLVVINDSDRAYALSTSQHFPPNIKSEYGRRRLKLLRLQAAFSLAVKERDYDRVLSLAMQLAQVASANAKGDEFIRESPGISVLLGDQDTSRRLFQDRTGWRGERDARLTIAFAFLDEMHEAEIHQNRAIGWINWHSSSKTEENRFRRSEPTASDFAAVIFLSVLKGDYTTADHNIKRWNFSFALSVCQNAISLLDQLEHLTGRNVLSEFAKFIGNKNCQSIALKIAFLSSKRKTNSPELRMISRSLSKAIKSNKIAIETPYDHENKIQCDLSAAAFSALIHNSRQSAARICGTFKAEKVTSYEYGERHGTSRAWTFLSCAIASAWSAGEELRYYHLTPRNVEITRKLKSTKNRSEFTQYLADLKDNNKNNRTKVKQQLFNRQEVEEITNGIELVIKLAKPLQNTILSRAEIQSEDFEFFLEQWESHLRFDTHWNSERAKDQICKAIGLGFSEIFLQHTATISEASARKLIDLLNRGRFTIGQRLKILLLLAQHANLHALVGQLALKLSEDIQHDEYISQRSEQYAALSQALIPISQLEARQYFQEGLKQLDQMGGDDHDIIYSLLRYGTKQRGGWLSPELGHRLMNLCQTIFYHDPSRFGWTLFSRAAAQSIGTQTIYKMIRWSDQDAARFSNGLPQLACFLAEKKHLDPRRAAALVLLCENEGWNDWKIGDGLKTLFEQTDRDTRKAIWRATKEKLDIEHPFGGAQYLWSSLLDSIEDFDEIASDSEVQELRELRVKTGARADEENQRRNSHSGDFNFSDKTDLEAEEHEKEEAFEKIANKCDILAPHSIDEAIRTVRKDSRFIFNPGKRIVERLRDNCSFNQQSDFVQILGELIELRFDDTVEILIETVELWSQSSTYISSNKKEFVERLFEQKGSELFDLRYTGILGEITKLIEFCGDPKFVLNLVIDTVSKEKVELAGDEWLQIATSLCQCASDKANLEAFEALLSSSAAQIGDEIGEGVFKESFNPTTTQNEIIAEILWHLLGNEDTFLRWNTARCIKWLADLGLHEDILSLLNCFDRAQTHALASEGLDAAFLNAQQWLLMGLSRACQHHGQSMDYLIDPLEKLLKRDDIHAVNKVHILRCLEHISSSSSYSSQISKIFDDIYTPTNGYIVRGEPLRSRETEYDFSFDYDFKESGIPSLARLFGISFSEAHAAIASEIQNRWPEAKDMNFFSGNTQYRRTRIDRRESFRESIQKHAMISAATKLASKKSVIKDGYEPEETKPWPEWLKAYDVSFKDGTWLSDHKDAVPQQAQETLTVREKNQDVLECDEAILKKIGMKSDQPGQPMPLYGFWRSRDGVTVRVSSALTQNRGIIGRCKAYSKSAIHDIWFPKFGSDGCVDQYNKKEGFEPLLWLPDLYPIGIDEGDLYATQYPITRPQLGSALNSKLKIDPDLDAREWHTQDGNLALRSQVWGQWRPEEDDRYAWHHDDGSILWAQPDWLKLALEQLNQRLVFSIDFYRHKPYRSFDDTKSLRAIYIAALANDGTLRIWKAREASKADY